MKKRQSKVIYLFIPKGEDALPSVKESTQKIRERYEEILRRQELRKAKQSQSEPKE